MGKKLSYIANLAFSPQVNPLVQGSSVTVRQKHVRTGLKTDLVDPETGELTHRAMVHTVEEVDDAHFVKIFASGVIASYDLNRTAQRVFQAILDEYQRTPMQGGFADTIYLSWFDGGLSGREIGMSEFTFKRGMHVLLEKGFISPRMPNQFWVNPSLFFKGDRVLFLKEYLRKRSQNRNELPEAK